MKSLKKKQQHICLPPDFLFLISYLDLPSYLTTHHVLIGKYNLFQDYPLSSMISSNILCFLNGEYKYLTLIYVHFLPLIITIGFFEGQSHFNPQHLAQSLINTEKQSTDESALKKLLYYVLLERFIFHTQLAVE